MTSEQVLIFEEWFTNEINSGAEWFEIRRLMANGYEPLKARFKSMYKGANHVSENKWSIEFDAELYTLTLDGDWWLFPDLVIDDCGNDMTCLLDCVVNEIWPPLFPEYVRNKCLIDCTVNEEWPLYE